MLDNLKKSMNIYGEVTTPGASDDMLAYYDEKKVAKQERPKTLKKEFESQKWNPDSDDKSISYSQNPLLLEQQQLEMRAHKQEALVPFNYTYQG